MTTYVNWDRPRHWRVRMYSRSEKGSYGHHTTIGVIAENVMRAIKAAQSAYPEYRIESVNDIGGVDVVVDAPNKENPVNNLVTT